LACIETEGKIAIPCEGCVRLQAEVQELEDALVEVLEEALKEDPEIILISDSGTTTLSNNAYGKAFNLLDKRGRFLPREEKAEEKDPATKGGEKQ
jgi:hypothetical protein